MARALIFLFAALICNLWAEDNSFAMGCQKKSKQAEPPPIEESLQKQFWKFHKFAALGYRRDRQRWSDSQSRTQIKGRNTIEFTVGSHMEWKEAVLNLCGSYGWLIDGNLSNVLSGNHPNGPASFRGYDLGAGYTADAVGSLGWRWKLYDQPSFGFSLIPAAGYRYSHLMNFPKGVKRSPLPSGFSTWSYPSPSQQDWFGPFAEGRLEFRFREKAQLDLFYQYHWPDLRWKTTTQNNAYLFNPPGTPSSITLTKQISVLHGNALRKQLGGVDLKIHHLSGWTFGVHFEGSSTWSNTCRNRQRTTQEELVGGSVVTATKAERQAEVHWTQYSVYLFMGYKF